LEKHTFLGAVALLLSLISPSGPSFPSYVSLLLNVLVAQTMLRESHHWCENCPTYIIDDRTGNTGFKGNGVVGYVNGVWLGVRNNLVYFRALCKNTYHWFPLKELVNIRQNF